MPIEEPCHTCLFGNGLLNTWRLLVNAVGVPSTARTSIVKIVDVNRFHGVDIRQIIVDTRPPFECRDRSRGSTVEDGHCRVTNESRC